jgi:Fe2+ transport system protein FeoA
MNEPDKEEALVALSSMSLGQKAMIVAFTFDTGHGESMQKLGMVPGEKVEVVRLPTAVDPIEIKIRGYFLSLPKQEADRIRVKLLP